MSLKRIAVRTRKSLSGLRGGFGNDHPSPPETPPKKHSSPLSTCGSSPVVDEFGMLPFSPSKTSPSPSKRNRLMGSWRRMKATFEQSKIKEADEEPTVFPLTETPPAKRPSLALNFEVSPPDRPMFGSSNSSALEIRRSSPIAIPEVSKPNTPPSEPDFLVGSIPDTPAPLHQEAIQQAILSRSREPTALPEEHPVVAKRPPTPMPRMENTDEDGQPPAIVVSSPSTVPLSKEEGFFAIPLPETANNTDRTIKVPKSGSLRLQRVRLHTDPMPTNFDFDETVIIKSEDFRDDLDDEARQSLEANHDFASTYLALTEQDEPTSPVTKVSLGDPEPDKAELGRRRSTWNRNAGLYDGTGYADPADDNNESVSGDGTWDSADSEEAVCGSAPTSPPMEEPPIDEKEALHEIIQAYAFEPTMIRDHDDDKDNALEHALEDIKAKQQENMKENAAPQAQRDISYTKAGKFYEPATLVPARYDGLAQEAKEESTLSIRVMNESLGG